MRTADGQRLLLDALLDHGEYGQRAIEGLLDHESMTLRRLAAVEMLKWDREQAIAILQGLMAEALDAPGDQAGLRKGDVVSVLMTRQDHSV